MCSVSRNTTDRIRHYAAIRRLRNEVLAERPPAESIHDRWLNTEAIEAAIELAAYFRDEWPGYGHAANVATAAERAS